MKQLQPPRRSAGFSLVEVMVALAIGMVVIAAVLVSYLGSSQAGREQAAYAELNENAQLAFDILARDLLMAGYSMPTGVDSSTGKLILPVTNPPVFGCEQGFASATVANPVCSAASGKPALRLTYQADLTNTVPTSAAKPSDCLGNGIDGALPVADNRYYLKEKIAGSDRFELYCAGYDAAGAASPGGQPLVDNVSEMSILYGVAADWVDAKPGPVVRYVSASGVADWNLVVSVRVCLLMRSNEPVLSGEGMLSYRDCSSHLQISSDRHLRRAYATTITLRNRMAL